MLDVKLKTCHDCRYLAQKAMSFNNVAICFVKEINFWYMSNGETINVLKNADLRVKRGSL